MTPARFGISKRKARDRQFDVVHPYVDRWVHQDDPTPGVYYADIGDSPTHFPWSGAYKSWNTVNSGSDDKRIGCVCAPFTVLAKNLNR